METMKKQQLRLRKEIKMAFAFIILAICFSGYLYSEYTDFKDVYTIDENRAATALGVSKEELVEMNVKRDGQTVKVFVTRSASTDQVAYVGGSGAVNTRDVDPTKTKTDKEYVEHLNKIYGDR